jgi:excisionase family DNA binding protein
MSEQIFKTAAAAKYIGVSKKTLLKYCVEHRITFMRYPGGEYRFRQSSLDYFMGKHTVQANPRKLAA